MNQTSIERIVEEIVKEYLDYVESIFDQYEPKLERFHKENFLREKLTSALSQARQDGREEALKLALELVEKNDPNVEMGRMTNPHYWGNCLRRELQDALTTEGK